VAILRFLAAFVLASAAAASSADTIDPTHLKPGEYVWHPEVAPAGPVVVIVSLDEQRAYVYRNGIAIGLSTISSGRNGYETPTGIFTILQKDRDHRSNKYDDAPMPFMERLTWDGVALHGGQLPGYPASHGCVRLPQGFAQKLFAVTERGQTVVVAKAQSSPPHVVHPAVLAPVGPSGAVFDSQHPEEAPSEWDDAIVPPGPVSILVSLGDRTVNVLRNGVRIGRAQLDIADGFELGGTLLFVVGEGFDDSPSMLDPARARHRWSMYLIAMRTATPAVDEIAAHLRVPAEFARALYSLLQPGTTIVITDFPAVRDSSALQTVLETDAGGARR